MTKTHCAQGHDLEEVGTYARRYVKKAGVRVRELNCLKCKSDQQKRYNSARAKGRKDPSSYCHENTNAEQERSAEILRLIDRKDRARTGWERSDIQARIDHLARPQPGGNSAGTHGQSRQRNPRSSEL